MKPEEAIEAIEQDIPRETHPDLTEAMDMALSALGRRIPREPVGDFVKMFNRFAYKCPACGTMIASGVLFCHECGQALLWEG